METIQLPMNVNTKNIKGSLEDNILIIKVDLTKDFGPSASGKTLIIASTGQGQRFEYNGKTVIIGVNIYRKP